jgi:hypothetical protein
MTGDFNAELLEIEKRLSIIETSFAQIEDI